MLNSSNAVVLNQFNFLAIGDMCVCVALIA